MCKDGEKIQENAFGVSRPVLGGRTDGNDEANSRFSQQVYERA
jgi:hypothetical protein